MSSVKVDVDVDWVRKSGHCRATKSAISTSQGSYLCRLPNLLHILACHHTGKALPVNNVRMTCSTLTLDVCTCQSEATRIVRSVVKTRSGL